MTGILSRAALRQPPEILQEVKAIRANDMVGPLHGRKATYTRRASQVMANDRRRDMDHLIWLRHLVPLQRNNVHWLWTNNQSSTKKGIASRWREDGVERIKDPGWLVEADFKEAH